MKKLLFTFLAALYCMVMNAQDVTFTAGGIKYNVTGDNTVEVGKNENLSGTVVIPSTVKSDGITYNVTGIGDNAFSFCSAMSSVTIPEGVTSIGASAFKDCWNLNSITIPEGVTSIGASAFESCEVLNSITIPKGVTSIGASVFKDCWNLNSITIPEGVTSIGKYAFDDTGWYNKQEDGPLYLCNYLVGFKGENQPTDIVIKDGTMTIADEAFQFCLNLTSINIPYSVTSIGDWAFPADVLESITVDSENPVYDSRNNCNAIIETATNTLITGCKNTIIPSDVTRIGNNAFRACDELTSVTIPSGVTHIGDYAFLGCWGLTEIYVLATTPPTLGYNAFHKVEKDIPVYVPDVKTYTGWGGFTNLIKNVDLPTAKEEAIADLQTFINKEKIANAPIKEYADCINAATALKYIPSIVNDIKDGISNSDKFTLGEWKYLLDDNDGEYTIVGGSLTFTDKDIYQSDYDFTVTGNLEYTRTFKATGVWQAWFVPFDVTVGKMNQAGMEVAKIAGVLMDGEVPYIAFAKMTDPYAIVNANTPYVVKATESSVNIKLTGPDIRIRKSTSAELEAKRLTVQSSFDTFTFGGNYQPTNGYANEWYALNTSGVFLKMGDGADLVPQRFWMKIDTRTDTPYYTEESGASAKAFINMTVLGDDETTGIESLTPTLSESKGTIYNLQGQRVTSIQKGQVYIMNGKKFLAK